MRSSTKDNRVNVEGRLGANFSSIKMQLVTSATVDNFIPNNNSYMMFGVGNKLANDYDGYIFSFRWTSEWWGLQVLFSDSLKILLRIKTSESSWGAWTEI